MKILQSKPIVLFNFSKIRWKWAALLLLLIVLSSVGFYLYEEWTLLPPNEAVLEGLNKTANLQSCRYNLTAVRILEGKEAIISEVNGEKNAQGVHLNGKLPIIKADVEIYHMGDTLYRRDTLTDGWVIVPEKGRAAIEQLIAEINPLGVFHFSEQDNIEVKYIGKEKVNKKTCRLYEVMGRGVNKYLELYWQDFKYRIWIDKHKSVIRKAQIMAEHRDNAQHLLQITVVFSDFDEEIEINPPVK